MNQLLQFESSAVKNMHWSFFGSFMQQTPNAVLSLNRLLNAENFDTIIELGTHDGGLSTLFALYCLGSRMPAQADDPNEPSLYKNRTHHKRPKTFYTFDYVRRDNARIHLLEQMLAQFGRVDFLNDQAVIDRIGGLIRSGGRVLLLCDGGDKPKEFSLYSPFLKTGDVIMAHDYAETDEKFAEIKARGIWHGLETKWSDIQEPCRAHNIAQVYREEFDDSVWFCGMKQ